MIRWRRFAKARSADDCRLALFSSRLPSRPTRSALLWAVLVAAASFAIPAFAESGLVLPYPTTFGRIPASTFDTERHRLGAANLVIENLDGGNVRLLAESGVDGGARTIATAVLAPIEHGSKLRLVSQSSRSFDASGTALGTLEIDHDKREGRCTAPTESGTNREVVPLPPHDRVANVPLNLLFDPLIRGSSQSVDFQVLLCRGGARLMDFQASVANRITQKAHQLIEVRYGPDLGSFVSFLARTVTPKLSFWFDPDDPETWLAHRMPLYSDGPEVFVVRQGVSTNLFID